VTVDEGLSVGDLKTLALRLRHIDPAHVTFVTVPVANPSVIEPDGEDAVALDFPALHRMFAGLSSSGAPPAGSSHRTQPGAAPHSHPTTASVAGQACAP
jgi:hypothetical protein